MINVVYTTGKGGLSRRFAAPAMLTTKAVVVVLVLLLVINTNCCRAAVLLKRNATYERYCDNGGGGDENCLIAEEYLELEFLMDSHVSRMLADGQSGGTNGANNPNAHTQPCGQANRGEPYCQSGAKKVPENTNVYHRP